MRFSEIAKILDFRNSPQRVDETGPLEVKSSQTVATQSKIDLEVQDFEVGISFAEDSNSAFNALKLQKVLKATISKDPLIDGSNEDTCILRLHGDLQRAAVFDGASESFAARKWSRLLSEEWGRGKILNKDWIANAQNRYQSELADLNLSWAQEAAIERGSFATIASLEIENGHMNTCVVGDSSLFFIDSRGVMKSIPFQSESEFTSSPTALSSKHSALEKNYENINKFTERSHSFKPNGVGFVLLATDAVSCWLLSDDLVTHLQRLQKLFECKTSTDFHELVLEERRSKSMKIDDSTVILLEMLGYVVSNN